MRWGGPHPVPCPGKTPHGVLSIEKIRKEYDRSVKRLIITGKVNLSVINVREPRSVGESNVSNHNETEGGPSLNTYTVL